MSDQGQADERDRRVVAASVERELALMFRRARSMSVTAAARVHPDLDSASYGLLLRICDAGWLRASEVAERTGLDKSTVSRQIAALVDLGLLERVPDPEDGRARRIRLSEFGKERMEQARLERRRHMEDEFESWSTQDLVDLARLLGKFNESF